MNTKNFFTVFALLFSCSINAQEHVKLPSDSIKIPYAGNYGLSIVKNPETDKYGVIDSTGNLVAPLLYDHVYPFFDELALVYKDDTCGYINLEGNIEIPLAKR